MVSSRKRAGSPTSSCSSYSDSWERQQEQKIVAVDREHERNSVEQRSVEDEREVARRVLEDLEELYFDEGGDDDSEDEDEVASSSEWGSEASSSGRSVKRRACGMTLEELTVAVNAAIEHHCPTRSVRVRLPEKLSESKMGEQCSQHCDEHHFRPRRRHQQNDPPSVPTRTGESVLETFLEMLERKERHFYALRASKIAAGDEVNDKHPREFVASRPVTVNQQQQTTAYVKDQATETEDYSHYQVLGASFTAAQFCSPPQSPRLGGWNGSVLTPKELLEPVGGGPTLADLAKYRRSRSARSHFSSQSFPASESARSLSSSSSTRSAPRRVSQHLQSSFASERSSVSSRSSRSSTKSDICSRHSSHSSKKSNNSKASSNVPPPSKSSRQSSRQSHPQASRLSRESSIETTNLNNWQFALAKEDQAEEVPQIAPVPGCSDPPQIPGSSTLVKWELDLSNFAF